MEIPKMVRTEKKPRLDGEAVRHPRTQPMAVTKVLEDDNLLREIIVRVGVPNTLVRAALVCKRWLEHASDRKFLSRFRELHPPRLLGCYIYKDSASFQLGAAHFVPMLPQPPELAAVMHRLKSYNFGAQIMHCRNGSVYTAHHEGTNWTREVHRPLCAEKAVQIIPPVPRVQDQNIPTFTQIILKEEGISMSYLYVLGEATEIGKSTTTSVYVLQDGVWCMHASATCPHGLHFGPKALLVDNKIYTPSFSGDAIFVLNLTASCFSTIQFPQGVKYRYSKSMLSRADDASSVYLIHVKEFQLRIWLHKGDNWLLVETICLHEMFATLGISLGNKGIASVQLRQVGDNGQFVILQMGQCLFYLDIYCRTLCKVYENKGNGRMFGSIYPFMMTWPPTFPALKDHPARDAM